MAQTIFFKYLTSKNVIRHCNLYRRSRIQITNSKKGTVLIKHHVFNGYDKDIVNDVHLQNFLKTKSKTYSSLNNNLTCVNQLYKKQIMCNTK